jgi:integrase
LTARKLTDAAIRRLKARPGERLERFDTLPGFGIRINGGSADGPQLSADECSKSFFVFYRVHGRLRRYTLGRYHPEQYPLTRARAEAAAAIAAARNGEDAAARRKAQREAQRLAAERKPDTVRVIVDDFLKKHMEGKRRAASYVDGTHGLFENHVLPRWAARDIKSISRRDVIELLDAVASESPPRKGQRRKRGGPIAANRVRSALSKLFNWTIGRSIRTDNPVMVTERPGEETRRERRLSPEEIHELWPVLDGLAYPWGLFFKLALATGQRRDEVATLRWDEISEADALWTIPGERTKNSRPHVVPLSALALEILAACKKAAPKTRDGKLGEHVFTVINKGPITGYSQAKGRLDEATVAARAMAYVESGAAGTPPPLAPWTIHDLRRTCATGMGKLGISRFIIGRVLNHTDRSVTSIYDQYEYLSEKRHALDTWGAYVGRLLEPPGANVAQLRSGA